MVNKTAPIACRVGRHRSAQGAPQTLPGSARILRALLIPKPSARWKRALHATTPHPAFVGTGRPTPPPGLSRKWERKTILESFDVTAGGDFDASRSKPLRDERHPYPVYSNAVTDSGLYGYCSYSEHNA